MNNLGYNVQPVTYGPDGKTVVNESNGQPPAAQPQAPPQRAAAAPPQRSPAAPPQQGARRPPPGMALVQKPDGSQVFIPKANVAQALKLNGKVLDPGQ
jgi:hypothetical protein